MIKNIIFDFGGILVNLNRERCYEAFAKLGFDVKPYIGTYAQNGLFASLENGDCSVADFCGNIRKLCSNQKVTDEEICEAWNLFIESIPQERLEALEWLSERYNLYLLSNTNEIHWKTAEDSLFSLKGKPILSCFKKIFLSYEMHMQKPSLDIFNSIIEQTSIVPEESLFIDDAEANCIAARKTGLKALWAPKAGEWIDKTKEGLENGQQLMDLEIY